MKFTDVVSEVAQRVAAHKGELLCLCCFALLYLGFLLTILQPLTILLLHLMPLPLMVLCYLRCKALKDQGLAIYLPVKMQEILFEKSLIDVLMAVWDMPRLVEYLKRLVYPFFVQMEKEEALMMFEELSPQVAAKMDAKGLIHVLPETVQKVLVSEVEMKDTLFLAPMGCGRPPRRARASLDLDSEGLKSSFTGRKRPVRVDTELRDGKHSVRAEIISSSGDMQTPLVKSSDNLNSVISRLRHRVKCI